MGKRCRDDLVEERRSRESACLSFPSCARVRLRQRVIKDSPLAGGIDERRLQTQKTRRDPGSRFLTDCAFGPIPKPLHQSMTKPDDLQYVEVNNRLPRLWPATSYNSLYDRPTRAPRSYSPVPGARPFSTLVECCCPSSHPLYLRSLYLSRLALTTSRLTQT